MTSTISDRQIRFYKYLMQVRPTILTDIFKKVFRVKRLIVESKYGQFWIDPVSRMGQAILEGSYEEFESQLISDHLNPGQTFIDVGANEGFYSILAAQRVGATGRVFAIEPQSRLIPVIKKNAALNNLNNVSVIQVALNDGSTKNTRIWLSPSTMTGSSSILSRYAIARPQTVQCKTLTEIFDEHRIELAHFAKIDVEGFEGEVIEGALTLLKQHRIQYLYVDYHTSILFKSGIDPGTIHHKIQSCGYASEREGNPEGYILYNKTQS